MPAETKTALPLPILDRLPHGRHSLGVPIKNGNVQIGFVGTPDSIDRLLVDVEPNAIEIARLSGELLQIESGVLERGHATGKKVVRKHVLDDPVEKIRIHRTDEGWEPGIILADPDRRVGMSRFAAKIGSATVDKTKRLERQARR